jgi:tetratricopeptide (TPR) repeat protein
MRFTGFLAMAGVFVMVSPSTAVAQQRLSRVAKNMPSKYVGPTCDLSSGHFLVSSAGTYLSSGVNNADPVKTVSLVEKGIEVSIRAITEAGQEENAAAWYYLGRNYLHLGDIVGADSAFTKAVALEPECTADVQSWRNRAWLPLITPASEFVNQGNVDSALVLFRQAQTISRVRPEGYYNMGVLYANLGQNDSAIAYFRETKRIASTDVQEFAKDRDAATFNLAAMLQRGDRHDEAAAELQEYLTWVPNDTDAKRALATSLRASGNPTGAAALEEEILAQAEAAGTLSTNDRMAMGINAFNGQNFTAAAEAFSAILESEPYNRDAMYNAANAYYALKDGAKLVELGPRLIALEPLNEDNHKLLAQGFQLSNQQDSLIAAVTVLLAMPTSVTVTQFAPNPSGAALMGQAVGRAAELDGEDIPPAAQSLVIEFLDKAGAVVATSDLEIPALEPAVAHDWKVQVEGAGIIAWRYRVK